MPTIYNVAVDINPADDPASNPAADDSMIIDPPPKPIVINININDNAKHDSVPSITPNNIQTKKKSLTQRCLYGLLNPPCPKCPEKPRSPHSDWTVIKLPVPKCVNFRVRTNCFFYELIFVRPARAERAHKA